MRPCLLPLLLWFGLALWGRQTEAYLLGIGKADVTGPAAEVNMMGYAKEDQNAAGIHTRLYARAFVIGHEDNLRERVVFVNLDACMTSQAVTLGVLEKLENMYGGLYTQDNVAISGIHTHSGPGGYLQYLLYIITSLGFVKENYDALVDGVVQAVKEAHDNAVPGKILVNSGELLGASINRSPTAYLNNPPNERKQYKYDTDKEMTLLRFEDGIGRPLGSLNWFAVHCTSLNNTNTLISGDNKGAAAQMMEKWASGSFPGFVGGFAQGAVGDVSPNTLGAFCTDTGKPCDMVTSTCKGKNQLCVGRGPGWPDMFESNRIIGEKQFRKALELLETAREEVQGPIEFRHMYIDMTNVSVAATNTTPAGMTCPAAMGFSFAAGTTDGCGAFDFKQGDTSGSSKLWRMVRGFIKSPTKKQVHCQAPKPILLDTGEIHDPYAWQPAIVEIQILRIGQMVILCVPGEFTTMSGRRLKNAVRSELEKAYGEVHIVIAGLTNTYSSYIATYEEYQMQRYEGASTIFGPHTLQGYIQEFVKMARAMVNGSDVPPGPSPPELLSSQLSLLPGVVFDAVPIGKRFGDVIVDVKNTSIHVGDTVEVQFRSANPRNDLRTNNTFLAVEVLGMGRKWVPIYTDNDLSTQFHWHKPTRLDPFSKATVRWKIGDEVDEGLYRLRHFGNYKTVLGGIFEFEGTSRTFYVRPRQLVPKPVAEITVI